MWTTIINSARSRGIATTATRGGVRWGSTTQDPELMERLEIDPAAERVANLLRVMTLEIQMLARACGKSDVHHLEPEDMAALTAEASAICGIPLAGTRRVARI